jgi:ankyrin repeat protein
MSSPSPHAITLVKEQTDTTDSWEGTLELSSMVTNGRTPWYHATTTPVSSPSRQAITFLQKQTDTTESLEKTFGLPLFVSNSTAPWHEFLDYVDDNLFMTSADVLLSRRQVESRNITSPHMIDNAISTRDDSNVRNSLGRQTSNGIFLTRFFSGYSPVHPVYFGSRAYLPPLYSFWDSSEHKTSNMHLDRVGDTTYLDFLKFVVHVISNNLDETLVEMLVKVLAQDSHARTLFISLLKLRLTSLEVCAERLWIPAVQHGNLDLVLAIVRTGVDLNIRGGGKDRMWSSDESRAIVTPAVTALQCAIEHGYHDIIDLLLTQGANDWHAKILYSSIGTAPRTITHRFKVCTLVDLAVRLENSVLLKKLLDCELCILGCHKSASLFTIRLAIMLRRLDLAEMISDSRPGLWDGDQGLAPLWIPSLLARPPPLDSAEDHQRLTTPDRSMTVAAHDDSLRSLVARICRRGVGKGLTPRLLEVARTHFDKPRAIPPGLPALHVAICGSSTQLLRMLLDSGADVNQPCQVNDDWTPVMHENYHYQLYPIQLATYFGSLEMVDKLIKYGCNVNVVGTGGGFAIDVLVADQPALCEAFGNRRLEIVRSLLKAGARFPEHREATFRHECYLRPLACTASCAAISDDDDGRMDWKSYFDPWVDAIRFYDPAGLCQTAQDRYIDHPMSTAHLARCILIHGAYETLQIAPVVAARDVLDSDAILDPLILCALAHGGDEHVARDVASRLINRLGRVTFGLQYGIRALICAVTAGRIPLIRLFLEQGVNPFTQVPDMIDYDSWRVDRWKALERWPSDVKDDDICGPGSNLPTDIVLQAWCSTPFQAACLCKNQDVIENFLSWEPAVGNSVSVEERKKQISAAHLTAVCLGDLKLKALTEGRGSDVSEIRSIFGASYVARHLRHGLQYAMSKGDIPLARRLLDLGADGNTPAIKVGYTTWRSPLQYACMNDGAEGFVKILLSRGADPNEKPHETWDSTPTEYAASRGNFEDIKLLIAAGGEINRPPAGEFQDSALRSAAWYGRLDMTIFLLDSGADVKGRTNQNYLESVKSAWRNGHHTLAKTIQQWKLERHGVEDCEPFENIVASVTSPNEPSDSVKRSICERIARKDKNVSSDSLEASETDEDFSSSGSEGSDNENDHDHSRHYHNEDDCDSDSELYVQKVYPSH